MRTTVPLLLVVLAACSGGPSDADSDTDAPGVATDVEAAGSYEVGTLRFEVTDRSRSRLLVVQAVYPIDAGASDVALSALEAEPVRSTYIDLLADAPAGCPTQTRTLGVDVTPAAGKFPVVLASHCHACTRLSNLSTAMRLASHGFVVLAPDHTGDTLWELLDGAEADLSPEVLADRAADLRFLLDGLVAGDGTVPAAIAEVVDLDRVGTLGHSFGAVTAAEVASLDDRVSAVVAMAAPIDNPLTGGVDAELFATPITFLVAVEDNSITEIGNVALRQNFDVVAGPAWKVEVADAGHWSFSDLTGLVEGFMPGCGSDDRQTDGTPFTYVDADAGRGVAASVSVATMRALLKDDAGARAWLDAAPVDGATVSAHD